MSDATVDDYLTYEGFKKVMNRMASYFAGSKMVRYDDKGNVYVLDDVCRAYYTELRPYPKEFLLKGFKACIDNCDFFPNVKTLKASMPMPQNYKYCQADGVFKKQVREEYDEELVAPGGVLEMLIGERNIAKTNGHSQGKDEAYWQDKIDIWIRLKSRDKKKDGPNKAYAYA